MSYILDALRKSEHERQIAAGQSVGMLYPIEIAQNRKPWLLWFVLMLATLITCAAIWWLWSKPVVTEVAHVIERPAVAIVSQPYATSTEVLSEPKLTPKIKKIIPAAESKKIHTPTLADSPPVAPVEATDAKSIASQTIGVDPLKDLPAFSITGYIHNAESGNLAMINNQLVHEGEEISPGLRLVKILDDSAIFSYKGFIFSR